MPVHRPRQAQRINQLFILVSITTVFTLYFLFFREPPSRTHGLSSSQQQQPQRPGSGKLATASRELVVASVKADDTAWIQEQLAGWKANIYVADGDAASNSGLSVPVNKGREAMVYLTSIRLAARLYDIHAWTAVPMAQRRPNIRYVQTMDRLGGQVVQMALNDYTSSTPADGASVISKLQLQAVVKTGYAPLRCTWIPGCPVELHPLKPVDEGPIVRQQTELAFAAVFKTLFPGTEVPAEVGATCSSQFAATREQVMLRPKADYERIRKWLVETNLPDDISGRIMEYMWHMIMQKKPVYCPPAGECYCFTFGLCNLECTAAKCEKQYVLPTYAAVPDGWPEKGGGENGWPKPGWNQ
ncbi:hypothetical protein TRV_07446 [Trichophyton verrucosum HKI 0517]|uniref:Uncharacterized protein n=1 Tax=Trichophyton verrucosum (strain HKI 0517) TaxID=663202 RepID=D4DJS8_TRIVH|nr:uncharacterized protein TRV_07446 [Trichophyton verrucosum HKI 0517]EFE37900.1 hypothetical protein TRV_07446 [Trichophyton verrucosum HKI 0517]